MPKFAYVGRFSDSGSKNSFYRVIGRKKGFKGFPTKELAEFAHAVQNKLSEHNLAPRVYSTVCKIRVANYFTFFDKKRNTYKSEKKYVLSDWGYLTEIAEPYHCDDPECDNCCQDYGCHNYNYMTDLIDEIDTLGVEYNDVHPGNFGYIKRGKHKLLVVIDLGRESILDYDRQQYPYVDYPSYNNDYNDCNCTDCRGEYQSA